MISTHLLDEHEQAAVRSRLNQVADQIRIVQQLVEDDRDYLDVLKQLAAAMSAANAASSTICAGVARRCLRHPNAVPSPESVSEQIIQAVARSGR